MPVFSVPAADVWDADDWQFLLVKSKAMLNNLIGLRFYIYTSLSKVLMAIFRFMQRGLIHIFRIIVAARDKKLYNR